MQKLGQEIICHECKTSHMTVPIEEEDEAPVHCSECGALMCFWRDVVADETPAMKKA
ncbi:hypothetical protein QFZ34_000955 [Phyllobacterium ifriqiyense]|uniref:Uncharacterized protein n=1 Tax=Phyllobacterium ifriqiyense TaxID=314238 RepID=A0ABU0S4V9_9HYPH|nr:hypothetical protein [Phyllobacterium ifriqiyense]MDQ0995778.1 hypothetical protein [Phyllobacterium ifriqiyense]